MLRRRGHGRWAQLDKLMVALRHVDWSNDTHSMKLEDVGRTVGHAAQHPRAAVGGNANVQKERAKLRNNLIPGTRPLRPTHLGVETCLIPRALVCRKAGWSNASFHLHELSVRRARVDHVPITVAPDIEPVMMQLSFESRVHTIHTEKRLSGWERDGVGDRAATVHAQRQQPPTGEREHVEAVGRIGRERFRREESAANHQLQVVDAISVCREDVDAALPGIPRGHATILQDAQSDDVLILARPTADASHLSNVPARCIVHSQLVKLVVVHVQRAGSPSRDGTDSAEQVFVRRIAPADADLFSSVASRNHSWPLILVTTTVSPRMVRSSTNRCVAAS